MGTKQRLTDVRRDEFESSSEITKKKRKKNPHRQREMYDDQRREGQNREK